MHEPDHVNVELQNNSNDREARIKELEEEIKTKGATISTLTEEHQSKIKQLRKKIDKLKNKKDQLKERINDLEEEVKNLNIWKREKDSRCSRLEKEIENNANSHKNEMEQLRKENSRKFESLKARTSNKIGNLKKQLEDNLQRFQSCNQNLEKKRASLEEDKKNLTSELKKLKLENCYLCIGQVCSKLQANMYHYVLPDLYRGEEWSYKVKHIKEDIEWEYKDDNEEKQALARLKTLEEKIQWEGKYEGVIDLLQSNRNILGHPSIPNVETAQKAAQELRDQKKLIGKICYGRVLRIIDMWELSVELLKQSKLM